MQSLTHIFAFAYCATVLVCLIVLCKYKMIVLPFMLQSRLTKTNVSYKYVVTCFINTFVLLEHGVTCLINTIILSKHSITYLIKTFVLSKHVVTCLIKTIVFHKHYTRMYIKTILHPQPLLNH